MRVQLWVQATADRQKKHSGTDRLIFGESDAEVRFRSDRLEDVDLPLQSYPTRSGSSLTQEPSSDVPSNANASETQTSDSDCR